MIALSTGSLYTYGLARVFELATQVGFDGIEVLVDHRWDSRDPAYLRRLSAEFGLPIVALHNPFVLHVPGWPSDQLGRLERTVALAQELDIPVIVTHLPFRIYRVISQWHGPRSRRFFLPVPWPRREPYYHLLRDGRLERMEATSGTTIAVENMPDRRLFGLSVPIYWFNRPEELARFPHLTLDTTHLGTWGANVLEAYEKLRARGPRASVQLRRQGTPLSAGRTSAARRSAPTTGEGWFSRDGECRKRPGCIGRQGRGPVPGGARSGIVILPATFR